MAQCNAGICNISCLDGSRVVLTGEGLSDAQGVLGIDDNLNHVTRKCASVPLTNTDSERDNAI